MVLVSFYLRQRFFGAGGGEGCCETSLEQFEWKDAFHVAFKYVFV